MDPHHEGNQLYFIVPALAVPGYFGSRLGLGFANRAIVMYIAFGIGFCRRARVLVNHESRPGA